MAMGFPFSIYRLGTGEIISSGQCSMYRDVVAQPISADEICIDVELNRSTQYVLNGAPAERPLLIEKTEWSLPDDGPVVQFAVPENTIVRYEGVASTVDDGAFEFEGDTPGEYRFIIEPPFPYQRQLVGIVVREIPAD